MIRIFQLKGKQPIILLVITRKHIMSTSNFVFKKYNKIKTIIYEKTFLKFTTITLSLLILCALFNSCQKDQAYNPEQKIKKIYIMRDIFSPKILWQEWTWDENKLMRIDYYPDDNSLSATEYYTYEENKLIKVEDSEGYFQISYTGFKYNKIEYFKKDDNLLIASWDFSYRNNKVSKIILTYDYSFWIPYNLSSG